MVGLKFLIVHFILFANKFNNILSVILCPVCGGISPLLETVDFNKTCMEIFGIYFDKSGFPVDYLWCEDCGFCFAPDLHKWALADFESYIYNAEYSKIDPDYIDVRPTNNAWHVIKLFCGGDGKIDHLDFGGGAGLLSKKLAEAGWSSISYDPFVNKNISVSQLGTFDLITAFEVFEHVPDVNKLMNDLAILLRQEGVILFSTLISDNYISNEKKLGWWYAAPRNGHISLFSQQSLAILAAKNNLFFASFSESHHLFWKGKPSWAVHLLP